MYSPAGTTTSGRRTSSFPQRRRDAKENRGLTSVSFFASLRLCGNSLTQEGDDVLDELMHRGKHLRAALY